MNSFLEPFRELIILQILLAICMFLFSLVVNAQIKEIPKYKASNLKLHTEIIKKEAFLYADIN